MANQNLKSKKKPMNRVTGKQAQLVANMMRSKMGKKPKMDAEDMIDHGVDEAKEKS